MNSANFCLGDSGNGPSSTGEKSARGSFGLCRSWLGYGELRRLTMRGFVRPRLLVQRSVAASASSSANQRRRSLGRTGGKGPGSGLGSAHQVHMSREGQTSLLDALRAGCCHESV